MKTRVFAVCVVVFLFCGITHAGLSDGQVAYYPFNGNANDESGNGNNGTVNGATLTKDRFGNANSAYSFDGIDDYIKISDPRKILNFDAKTEFYTISTWVQLSSLNSFQIIILDRGSSNNNYSPSSYTIAYRGDYNNKFGASAWDSLKGGVSATNVFSWSEAIANTNNWFHLVMVVDTKKVILYVDGNVANVQEAFPLDFKSTRNDETERLIGWVGSTSSGIGPHFYGEIDDIRIYNRSLSEIEIQQLYNERQVCPDVAVKPYTFIYGTPAKAGEVNADFDMLYQQINTQNCQIQALKAIVCKNEPTASVCQ